MIGNLISYLKILYWEGQHKKSKYIFSPFNLEFGNRVGGLPDSNNISSCLIFSFHFIFNCCKINNKKKEIGNLNVSWNLRPSLSFAEPKPLQ